MIVDYFKYIKFNRDVHFFCFITYSASFVEKIVLAFLCYLIKLSVVYLQRSQWLFFFQLKDERSQVSNPHFGFRTGLQ